MKRKPIAEVVGYCDSYKKIEAILNQLGESVSVRPPVMMSNTPGWHFDCSGTTPYILVWSNRESTEVQGVTWTKKMLRFPPGSIVLIDNKLARHRSPPVQSPDRWFARVSNVNLDAVRRYQQQGDIQS